MDRGFRDKVDAMFNQVEGEVTRIGRAFVRHSLEQAILPSDRGVPGPGNQYYHTAYIADGTLRGGHRIGERGSAPATVSRMDGGPKDEEGDATVSRLMGFLSAKLVGRFEVWNDVGYGHYVYYGIGNHTHIGARPWFDWTVQNASEHFARAKAEVMG